MKAIFKMEIECGRMGTLNGVFIDTEDRVNFLINSDIEVYFGEVLGKHSEVYGQIDIGEIVMITNEPSVVQIVEEYDLIMGINPMDVQTAGTDIQFEDWTVGEVVDKMMEGEG